MIGSERRRRFARRHRSTGREGERTDSRAAAGRRWPSGGAAACPRTRVARTTGAASIAPSDHVLRSAPSTTAVSVLNASPSARACRARCPLEKSHRRRGPASTSKCALATRRVPGSPSGVITCIVAATATRRCRANGSSIAVRLIEAARREDGVPAILGGRSRRPVDGRCASTARRRVTGQARTRSCTMSCRWPHDGVGRIAAGTGALRLTPGGTCSPLR